MTQRLALAVSLVLLATPTFAQGEELSVGFGRSDTTPPVGAIMTGPRLDRSVGADDPLFATTLVALNLETKDFGEVNRLLEQIAAEFDLEFGDLTQIPEYAEYVKSPEYQNWLESQTQNNLESDALVQ